MTSKGARVFLIRAAVFRRKITTFSNLPTVVYSCNQQRIVAAAVTYLALDASNVGNLFRKLQPHVFEQIAVLFSKIMMDCAFWHAECFVVLRVIYKRVLLYARGTVVCDTAVGFFAQKKLVEFEFKRNFVSHMG